VIGHANGPCVGLDLRSRPPSGAGRVQVETGRRAAAAQIEVEFFRPRDAGADTPLLFLLHGRDRDADRYRDAWIPFALRHRRIVVAPRFAREVFGGSRGYNQGNVLDAQGARQSRRLWSLGVVEDVFDALT
jgi:poly(3-hydroxybutyrate) depolymerase